MRRRGHSAKSTCAKSLDKATCNLSKKQQMLMPLDNGKKVITEVMFDAEAPWQGVDSATQYHYRHPALTVCASLHGVTWACTPDTCACVCQVVKYLLKNFTNPP